MVMTPTYAGIFAAGVLTFGTPCVLPIIPIYLSVLLGAAIATAEHINRTALITRAFFFSLGFVTIFSLLGVGASALGQILIQHQQALQLTGGLVILLFSLRFIGLLEIPLLDRSLNMDNSRFRQQLGPVGAFGMGLVFALGWSPCVGPMLGAVLTYTASTTSDPWVGASMLATYGLGFAVPLMLVAIFAQAGVRQLKRLNQHLPKLQKASGVLLLVVAMFMIYGEPTAGSDIDPGYKLTDTAETVTTLPFAKKRPFMVEFYKDDCPVCKKMAPIVASLQSECAAQGVDILQINLSRPENRHFIATYALRGVPTFVAYDEAGDIQAKLVGEQRASVLADTIGNLSGALCTTGITHEPEVAPVAPLFDEAPSHDSADGTCSDNGEGSACAI